MSSIELISSFNLQLTETIKGKIKINLNTYFALLQLSTNTQLLLIFSGFFFLYFQPKNKSVAVLCIDFLVETIEKINSLKF